MTNKQNQELENIITSAMRLGVELDESDALQWLTAVSAQRPAEIEFDHRTGVFGHTISMLDFDDADLDHFRAMGKIVEFEDIPGRVETALALSGSAAQSKIQTYPGDADYFERVNILADTREEACQILADLIREKALATLNGETYQLMEVKFGSFPGNLYVKGTLQPQGSPISWRPEDIQAGKLTGKTEAGGLVEITWEDAARDPGWCKLDWVVLTPSANSW